jgi:hypothetical protein
MNITRNRARSIGWAFILTMCFALMMALTVRVNAVKSEVRLAERKIVALKREKLLLETEFQTRASQSQLHALNEMEFGYAAATPGQYLSGERQLAALGKAAEPDAPAPIRVAKAIRGENAPLFPAMVSPISGKPVSQQPQQAATAIVAKAADAVAAAVTEKREARQE